MDYVQSMIDAAGPLQTWFMDFAPRILSAIAILVLGWIASTWIAEWLRHNLHRANRLDPTVIPVISSTVRYAALIIVMVASLSQLGVPTTSILAVLGAAGLAIGLALQGTLSNIAAGIMLLWLRPFRVGDYIDADGIAGTVREIGLFATQLDTFDGIYRFVPNSEIWNKPIFNYTRNPKRMTDMSIGISYDADIAAARQIMLDLAGELEPVATDPPPVVFVNGLDDSSVTLRFRVWISNPDYWGTQRFLLEETKRRFDAAGIEIPFPQRVVHMAKEPDGTGGDKKEAPTDVPLAPPEDLGNRPGDE